MQIRICDDNTTFIENYSTIIKEVMDSLNIPYMLQAYTSGEQLLFEAEDNMQLWDIVYLDILMGKKNGIETAKELREMGYQGEIIFLTSSEEYVFESFDSMPLHYILKDTTSTKKFKEILLHAIELRSQKEDDYFLCEAGTLTKKFNINSIYYFEVQNRIMTIYYNEGQFDFYSSMDKIIEQLEDKGFIRTHRSFMVNVRYIDYIQKKELVLVNGVEIPVGVTYYKKVKDQFSSYLLSAK